MTWFLGWVTRLVLLAVIVLALLIIVGRYANPTFSALMALRAIGGAPIERQWVDLGAISPELSQAVLTSEDNHFCAHQGVDWGAVNEVWEDFRDGGEPRGASTLTMQVAKNLFLWPSRSYVRKGLEVPLAYAIDLAWPKRRIVEVYLNLAEWGPGVYGAEAAARHHFAKSARDLTRREATLLAASLPAPLVRSAGKPGPVTRRTAARIDRRMRQTQGLFACIDGAPPPA